MVVGTVISASASAFRSLSMNTRVERCSASWSTDRAINPPWHGRRHCWHAAFGVDRGGERQADADEWAVGWVERLGDERWQRVRAFAPGLVSYPGRLLRCRDVQAESGDDDPNPVRVDLEAGDDR